MKRRIILPGLVAAVAIGLISRFASSKIVIRGSHPVSEVILAIVIGLTLNLVVPFLRPTLGPGASFALKRLLRVGIVLLGLSLSLTAVVKAGASSLLIILVCVSLSLLVTAWLGKVMGVRERLATLIAVGTGICGATAIVAAAPAIDADEDEVCYSIAVITVFGVLAIFLYPLIGRFLNLSDSQFGTWAGIAVHETAQVVAAGFAFSDAAGKIATVVKLTRTTLLAPLVLFLATRHARRAAGSGKRLDVKSMIPWFIGGFLALALLRSVGDAALTGTSVAAAWTTLKSWVNYVAKLLIVTAMAGVGLSCSLEVFRTTGIKPLLIGLAASILMGAASLAMILLAGMLDQSGRYRDGSVADATRRRPGARTGRRPVLAPLLHTWARPNRHSRGAPARLAPVQRVRLAEPCRDKPRHALHRR